VTFVTDHRVPREQLVGMFVSSPECRNRLIEALDADEGAPVATSVDDLTIYVDPNDHVIGEFLRQQGAYEPDVTAAVRRYLSPGACFVDVGAAFGYYSVVAGRCVGSGGTVIAIEPGPQNQRLLLLNLQANAVETAEVHQVALSDEPAIWRYGRSGANGQITPFDGDPRSLGSYDLVRATTLDRLVGERAVEVMKIDVEGAEGRVLRGGEATLKRSMPVVLFEFSPPSLEATSGMAGGELLGFLGSLGYNVDFTEGHLATATPRSSDEIMEAFDDYAGDHLDLIAWPR
jgi:FkbM family methyltransferase